MPMVHIAAATYAARHRRGKKNWKRDDWVDPHSGKDDCLHHKDKRADKKHLLNQEQADKLWIAFCNLDTNHDGHIDRAELKQLYITTVDQADLHDVVEEVMEQHDKSKDGFIEFAEFYQAITHQKLGGSILLANGKTVDDNDVVEEGASNCCIVF